MARNNIKSVRVKDVAPLASFRLLVTFSDGTSGEADLSHHVTRKPYLKLRDETVFQNVVVEHGAVDWPDGNVSIATEALYALVHGLKKPETLEDARKNEAVVSLRELRKMLGITQVEAAKESELTQGAIALFEGATDHKLSALRRYLGALGCELEIAAMKDGKRFPLHGL